MVQTPSPKESAPTLAPAPAPVQSNVGADNGRNQAESKVAEVKPKVEVAVKTNTKLSKSKVNVRETNTSGSTILAVLSPNEEVEIIEEQEKVSLIKVKNGKKGWVSNEYLK